MTATNWKDLSPDQKREAVRALLKDGKSYSQAADLLGCSRTAIAGVVERSTRTSNPIAAAHKPGGTGRVRKAAASKPKAKNATQIVQEKARRARAEDRRSYDYAWDALPGTHPVRLEDHTGGCRWPIDTGESVARFCNEPATHGRYCERHNAIGTRPEPERARRTVAGKIKAFNL